MKKTTAKLRNEYSDVEVLRSSVIHNLTPVSETPNLIDIEKIDIDPTNPGSRSASLRYQRRAPSIRDSYDILSKNIYPIVVCENQDKPKRFIHVDGFGRLDESIARGLKKISAIIYPPMSLEQRILFRQTLNAAQEPFDATSIINDLWELAKERKLDISNSEHIKTLVRDLPIKVRKHEKDLLILARWHPKAVTLLGESYKESGETMGIDKFRELDSIVKTMESHHPKTVVKLGGVKGVTLKLATMYTKKKFSEGTRSQDAIRRVVRTFKILNEDDRSVANFFLKEKGISGLPEIKGENLKEHNNSESGQNKQIEENPIEICKTLTRVLLDIDAQTLTVNERRVLNRTATVLNQVLHSVS